MVATGHLIYVPELLRRDSFKVHLLGFSVLVETTRNISNNA